MIAGDGDREAVWQVDDAGAARLVALGDGEHEVTRWYWGTEESRRLVRSD